jgi:hypothetical protein
VNLIMDSTDFRLSRRVSASKKDSSWSYKLNGPGQRFQAFVDAKRKFQGLWGGYSPKIYNGDWVKMMKEYLIRDFPSAQIIADTHYEIANQVIKEVYPNSSMKFFTPIAKPKGRKRKRVENIKKYISAGATTLTTEQEIWNKQVAHVRARVESPFGLIKAKWKSLSIVFFGDVEQHDCFVQIAVAVHNYLLT